MRIPLLILCLELAGSLATQAAQPDITSFEGSGRLTFQEVPAAASYRVEWTTNLLSAAWSSNAPGIPMIPALGAGNQTVTVGVVHAWCYYRVVASVTNGPPSGLVSTFASDSENWLVVNYPFRSHVQMPQTTSLPYDGGFGNPPGSVRVGISIAKPESRRQSTTLATSSPFTAVIWGMTSTSDTRMVSFIPRWCCMLAARRYILTCRRHP